VPPFYCRSPSLVVDVHPLVQVLAFYFANPGGHEMQKARPGCGRAKRSPRHGGRNRRLSARRCRSPLNAWDQTLRRDECGAWCISGERGTAHSSWFGDGGDEAPRRQGRCDPRGPRHSQGAGNLGGDAAAAQGSKLHAAPHCFSAKVPIAGYNLSGPSGRAAGAARGFFQPVSLSPLPSNALPPCAVQSLHLCL
jgi:hypothetical protein